MVGGNDDHPDEEIMRRALLGDRDANALVLQQMVVTLETIEDGDRVLLPALEVAEKLMVARTRMEHARSGGEDDDLFAGGGEEVQKIDFGFDTAAFVDILLHLLEQSFEDDGVHPQCIACLICSMRFGLSIQEQIVEKAGVTVVTRAFQMAAPGTSLQMISLQFLVEILRDNSECIEEFLTEASIDDLVTVLEGADDPVNTVGSLNRIA